jgi:hypothetical protein
LSECDGVSDVSALEKCASLQNLIRSDPDAWMY